MALKSYLEKRNFQKTSEPKGKKKITGKFRFVVQKHQAQQLHYDFRIEHEGVLVSWAVPKGVPTSSKEKHLAMHVEDHPLDYMNFEGTIPEGEYGAGTVMVWDKGTYNVPKTESRPEFSKKIQEGLEKGEIKLFLKGKKLKGLFVLVRFKRAGEKAWLFIKDKDYYNNFKVDNEHSAKSGLTMEEITRKFGDNNKKVQKNSGINSKQRTKISSRNAVGYKMPEIIKPMLATLKDEPFNNKNWLFEPKFDGYRVLAFIENGKVRLFSRNSLLLNEKYPEIVTALESYKFNFKAIFDGEVVITDNKGRISFQLLQDYQINKIGRISYQVFDLLYFKNLDLLKLPLIERKKALVRVLKDSQYVKLVKSVADGKKLYDSAEKNGYEGIIAKKKDSIYEPGMQSFNWYKIKNSLTDEFVIGGYTFPEGHGKGFGSLLLGTYKNGQLLYVGKTGTGFNKTNIAELMAKFKDLAVEKSPFVDFQGDKIVAGFVKPNLSAQIKYAELTKDGKLRQAVYLGIRLDKKPQELLSESQSHSTIKIKAEHVYLAPGFRSQDYSRLLSFVNNLDVVGFLRKAMYLSRLKSEEQVKKYFEDEVKDKHTKFFGVYDLKTDQIIGYGLLPDPTKTDAEFGLIIGDKSYWGKGIGQEAGKLMVDYAFNKLGLTRLHLTTGELNERAKKSFTRLGFIYTGLIPKDRKIYFNKKWQTRGTITMELKNEFNLITHPDKIYFPEKKHTKLDVAKYYSEIAEFFLPYLKDRPQNMNRHPNGIHGESFYHKDYEAKHPDFVKIFNYHSESTNETISHIVCNNKETLLYMINLGCIEINPWNSRTDSIEKPDYLVLDLDPDTGFDVVIEVALIFHEILDKYGIPNYVKTSGIKGLHIYVPLGAKYSYEQVRTFAELLGKMVQKEMPKVVTLERDPDKRKGKVYIDYVQNRIGQTTVAVYSIRPIKEAAVSCPLEWKEVRKGLKIESFTFENILKRLEKKGDLWKGILDKRVNFIQVLEKIA